MVRAEPFRRVRELIEDRLVQLPDTAVRKAAAEKRKSPSVTPAARGLQPGVAPPASAAAASSPSAADSAATAAFSFFASPVTGAAGPDQLPVPPDKLGQLGREEDQLGVRPQVSHLRKLDVGVERRLAHRRADPPSRVE